MILTYNYNGLQNIKNKIQNDNIKSTEKIYCFITSVKDTLNFMFENKLTEKSKKELNKEFLDFKNSLLKHSNISYKQLENEYKYKYITAEDCYINSSVINL